MAKKHIFVKLFLSLLVLAGGSISAFAQSNGRRVTVDGLSGQLASYGRFGHGETPADDDINLYWVLIPDHDESYRNVTVTIDGVSYTLTGRLVQLILPYDKNINLEAGCRYRVTGTISPAETGGQHTQFVMQVESVKVLRGPNQRNLHW